MDVTEDSKFKWKAAKTCLNILDMLSQRYDDILYVTLAVAHNTEPPCM